MPSLSERLVLHPHTATQVARYLKQPSSATLLVGPDGMGKGALAEAILQILLETTRPLAQLPSVLHLKPANASISIDAVREAQRFLQHKTAGTRTWRRAILVEQAELLTTEAQNALLKMLEEPPHDTLIVLTAPSARALLPTIISRAHIISVIPPTEEQLREHFGHTHPADAITQAYSLGGGLPGLMRALLTDDQAHPLRMSVEQAKALLRMSTFERLCEVEQYSKQKLAFGQLLEALQRIAEAGVRQTAAKQNDAQLRRWHRIRQQTFAAQTALMHSSNPKLTITNFMLHM